MALEKVVFRANGDAHQDKEPVADGYEIREAGLDVRGRTITTAIAWAVHEQFASREVGDEIELETDPFPAMVPAFDRVIVCEYLTFMEVMQQADEQLYA